MLRTPNTPEGPHTTKLLDSARVTADELDALNPGVSFVLWVPIDAFKGRLVPWSC